jgi:hypothetical protein
MTGEPTESRREFWARQVSAWRASGLSQQAYCAREGLRPSTFGWWRWRLSAGKPSADPRPPAPRLVPVRLRQSAVAPGFELEFPGERRLHIPSDFDETALSRLLRVLQRAP